MHIQKFNKNISVTRITRRGLSIFQMTELPTTDDGFDEIAKSVSSILEKTPDPSGAVDAPLRRGQYLTAVGFIFGQLIASKFGWKFCEIRKDCEREDEGITAVVSPERTYFIYPIGVVHMEAQRHGGETLSIYEKIKRGDLPELPPGAFLDLGKYIEEPNQALRGI
jgi:hypothetical protein